MTHRDPTIIGLCHPRDVHWLNAGLNAETREDWERVGQLREIAQALGNLPPVSVGLDLAASGGSAFQGINRTDVAAPLKLDDVSKSTEPSSAIVQPETPTSRARDSL